MPFLFPFPSSTCVCQDLELTLSTEVGYDRLVESSVGCGCTSQVFVGFWLTSVDLESDLTEHRSVTSLVMVVEASFSVSTGYELGLGVSNFTFHLGEGGYLAFLSSGGYAK